MALYHKATITPTKLEAIAGWAPTRPWGPPADAPLTLVGAYRFDDPDGQVGMETHLLEADGALFHVPLTYRNDPLAGAEDALICQMEHSVLGTRWVYDGLRDPLSITMLAAVTMTGQGQALGMVVYDGRWHIAPTNVTLIGGGWGLERVPVDGFEPVTDETDGSVLRNDGFELTVFRRPVAGERGALGLTASAPELPEPVVLSRVRPLGV